MPVSREQDISIMAVEIIARIAVIVIFLCIFLVFKINSPSCYPGKTHGSR